MGMHDNPFDLAQVATPSAAASGRDYVYTKSGDRLWIRGNSSGELPVGCDSFICTASTRPSSPFSGMTIYETDTKNSLVYDGVVGAWKYVGNRCLCTSSTRPTGSMITEGLEIYESDTDKTYININGSWVQNVLSTGPAELGYAQITSNSANNTTATPADVTGLSITVTVGSRPVILEAQAETSHSSGSTYDYKFFCLYEGSTQLGRCIHLDEGSAAPTTQYIRIRLTPSAGSHSYKVAIAPGSGSRGMQIYAGAGGVGNFPPAWIRAFEA